MKTLQIIWLRFRSLWQQRGVKREIDEGCRENRGARFGEGLWHDVRFGLRTLRKNPGFTFVAIATMALGIGANTAIFSVVNALLLRPLPYPDSDRIVAVGEMTQNGGFAGADGGVFSDWEDATTQLESIAAVHRTDKNLTGDGDPVRVSGLEVSGKYLHVLRVNPALGRDFTADEDAPGGNRHVVLLTHEFWQSRFQGDREILSRVLRLDGESYSVIGVLPPRSLLVPEVNFLIPSTIRADAWKQVRNYNYVCSVVGRLKPGATMAQATAELVTARKAVLSQYPSFRQQWTIGMRPLREATYGNLRTSALILLVAVGAVLLIACANVANLLLAKASSRQNEMAVRIATGATTGRIVRQLMTESMLLALAGGLAGILVGALAIKPLVAFAHLDIAAIPPIGIDKNVLLFTLGATILTGLIFGIFPAFSAARQNLNDSLKEGSRGTAGGSRRRMQSLLIVSETALTVVLLVCAGLLLSSFFKAYSSNPGFNRDNVLVFNLTQPPRKAPTIQARTRFISDILDSLRKVPGVAYAGMASTTPMNGRQGFGEFVSREEKPETRNDLNAAFDAVDGDFFKALGIPLLRGRFFSETDNQESAPKVMIINEALSRRLFGDEDPLGKLLNWKNATWEIVGVVGNVRQYQLDVEPRPGLYLPPIRFPWYTTFVVHTKVPPMTLAADMRRAVQAVDPEQPLANLETMKQAVERSLQGRKTMLTLLLVFAAIALALSCIGIYGVMAYAVSQRTREMGVRIALGAGVKRILLLVVRDGLKLVLIGAAIGMAASFGAGRILSNQLYATSGGDPLVLGIVAFAVLAVATVACLLPARRATRVSPTTALRCE